MSALVKRKLSLESDHLNSILLIRVFFHTDEFLLNQRDAKNHFDHLFHPIVCVILVHLFQQLFQYTKNLDFSDRLFRVFLLRQIHSSVESKPTNINDFLSISREEEVLTCRKLAAGAGSLCVSIKYETQSCSTIDN